jgi:hypothetical protein
MPERYTDKVRRYCNANGIAVPVGFGRHPASRYVVVELTDPPKLVARTWFKQEDVAYFFEHRVDSAPCRILDFKEGEELQFSGGKRLKRVGSFAIAKDA